MPIAHPLETTDRLHTLWTSELDPLFWPLSRSGVESAWTTHVPFAHWLVATHRPRSIVELGTHNGVSYSAFCEAVHRLKLGCQCLAVDTWQGDEHAGFYGNDVLAELRRFHDGRYAAFSELLRSTFDDALLYVPDGSVDLLHIDGLHTYDAVHHDFEAWLPKLTDRAVVLLHDINVRERGFGVWRLFGELSQRFGSFEFFHGHGLGLLAIGDAGGDAVRDLCNLPDGAASVVRERFSLLGERWQGEMQAQLTHLRSGQQASQLDATRHEQVIRATMLEGELAKGEARLAEQQKELQGCVAEGALAAAARNRALSDLARERDKAAELASELAATHRTCDALQRRLQEHHSALDIQHKRARDAAYQALLAEQRLVLAHHAAEAELQPLRSAVTAAVAERDGLLQSTTWRAMAPIRLVTSRAQQALGLKAKPGQARPDAQSTSSTDPARLAAMVARSALFNAAWYEAHNADVAASGIDAAQHYAEHGEAEGRDPGPMFSVEHYKLRHPEAIGQGLLLLHASRFGQEADGLAYPDTPRVAVNEPPAAQETKYTPTIDALLDERFRALRALPVYAAPRTRRRLTVITDSINAGSLYGGVGTALILAALSAKRIGASLRLVTRTEPPVAANIGAVLALQGVPWDENIDMVYAPGDDPGDAVALAQDDLFLTTSWWTTWAARQSVSRGRIAYLLQEDERMFYPFGDDHLRCSETLRDPALLYIVNSHLLLHHLQAAGLAPGGVALEPSFPETAYHARDKSEGASAKRQFFFYARPVHGRNLYWRGVEALSAAIEQGVLNPAEWDFHFAGKAARAIRLPHAAEPIISEDLPWSEYAALIRRMDLGLSLMYTPHPSYPPLDLAASGAVVVTNRFDGKTSLEQYSANIICADLSVSSLVAGLAEGARRVANPELRTHAYANSGLGRDWAQSASAAVDRLEHWANSALA